MTFDTRIVWLCLAAVLVTVGVLLCLQFLLNRSERAMLYWGLGKVAGASGAMLVGLRGLIPNVWSIAVGNVLVTLAMTLLMVGCRLFNGQSVRTAWIPLPAGMQFVVYLLIDALGGGADLRGAVAATFIGGLVAAGAVSCAAAERVEHLRWRTWFIGVLVGWVVVMVFRVVSAALLPGSGDPVGDHVSQFFSAVAVIVLSLTNGVAFMMMSRERIDARLTAMTMIDGPTGVLNRLGLQRSYRELGRGGRPVVVVLTDIDDFKTVNDRHGHAVGDAVLGRFAAVAQRTLGAAGVVGRYGGDEFCLLLGEATVDDGHRLAERVRLAFGATATTTGDGDTVRSTVSIGVAVASNRSGTLNEALKTADAALYEAKSTGRNRSVIASDAGDRVD
ncbi:MAG: GGDEF domain-containing protein [Gordonia sp. (in: high G+C Gram-positive bacteria)]|uniref:GGDEF domain-containing protein n=1 Tax=Gordonia sp. (in: high G+C Gram-positive bacteria) TaxID=84139 RepID=UPI0039E721D1